MEPDQMALKVLLVKHKFRGCIITSCYNAGIGCADPLVAAGQKQGGAAENEPKLDFVSRFFAPNLGIPEDPVTGKLSPEGVFRCWILFELLTPIILLPSPLHPCRFSPLLLGIVLGRRI